MKRPLDLLPIPRLGGIAVLFLVATLACTTAGGPSREERVQQRLEAYRDDPEALALVLAAFPKGADLHSHLSGAVRTEKLLEWGVEDGLCVDTLSGRASEPPCADEERPLAEVAADPEQREWLLGLWSLRDPSLPLGERRTIFFDSFGKFGAVLRDERMPYALADVLESAALHGQIYVELMQSLGSGAIGALAVELFDGDGDDDHAWTEDELLRKREELIAHPSFAALLDQTQSRISSMFTAAREQLGCTVDASALGCDVEARFNLSANRTRGRAYVFGQWVFGYELVKASPLVVGINLVSPEEDAISLQDYDDMMFALGVLRRNNEASGGPKVRVGLHAGELVPELLPPTETGRRPLHHHIRSAVEVGGAERIGHGASLLYDDDRESLLDELRRREVLVEICLGSNRALLDLDASVHPLRTYIDYGVPVALATDDLGVLRSSATDEFVLAFTEHGLDYRNLKRLARASLAYSFMPGASLFTSPDFDRIDPACAEEDPSSEKLSAKCVAFLQESERARLQWELERRLDAFERAMLEER